MASLLALAEGLELCFTTTFISTVETLGTRVTERAICGLRPANIDWIWIVELRRRATPEGSN